MTTLRATLATAAGLALAATGCMTDAASGGDPATTQADLEQATGGLTTADEPPMFGAETEYAAAAIEADAPAADPMAQSSAAIDLAARPDVERLRVAMVWGLLPPDKSATDVYDWTGTISVNRGALLVRHTIGFEAATDHLMPRTALDSVSFASKTRPFADGLALTILDPTPAAADPLTLTYTPASGGAPVVFAAADLAAGPVSVDVDALGHRMIAAAHRGHDDCDHGFLRGRWHAFRDGLGGFLGVVADADGNPIGHVRGIWGVRKSGEQVFFGKYIAADGTFRGLLAGHWENGAFVGRWLDKVGEHGRVQGLYHASSGDVGAGHFLGRWAESSCAADLPDPSK